MPAKKRLRTIGRLHTLSAVETIDAIRKGMGYRSFDEIVRSSPFVLEEWSQYLHLSDRTMQRYRKDRVAFDPIHTEKIYEIARLCDHGVEVFGDRSRFDAWLEAANIPLGDRKPKELLDSSFGIELVRDELTRIEHGMLA